MPSRPLSKTTTTTGSRYVDGGAQVAEQHHQAAVAGEGDDRTRSRSRACAPSAIGSALAIEPRL